jgi:hypothetical protein
LGGCVRNTFSGWHYLFRGFRGELPQRADRLVEAIREAGRQVAPTTLELRGNNPADAHNQSLGPLPPNL